MEFSIRKPNIFRIGDIYAKYYFFDLSRPLVVTFSPFGEGVDENYINEMPDPWGYEYILKKNYNILSFSWIHGKESYYRDLDFINSIEELGVTLPKFPERLGYGDSMGGYAVSAFSTPLKLDRILLFNPISTRNRQINMWDYEIDNSRYSYDFDWQSPFFDGAQTKSNGYIVYDPFNYSDRMHANRYQKLIHLRIPGLGHGLSEPLNKLGLLDWLINLFLEERLKKSELFQKSRSRRNLAIYYQNLLRNENRLTENRKCIIENFYNKRLFVDRS